MMREGSLESIYFNLEKTKINEIQSPRITTAGFSQEQSHVFLCNKMVDRNYGLIHTSRFCPRGDGKMNFF